MSLSHWSWSSSQEGLQQRWRRVASTHDLQDLADDPGPTLVAGGRRGARLACWGALLLMLSFSSLLVGFFSIAASKAMPEFQHPALRALQQDSYYCLLIPLTVPATIIAVIVNWVSMKLFKHNS